MTDMTKFRCPVCSGNLKTIVSTSHVNHNGNKIEFEDIQSLCEDCGEVIYVGDQISRHELARASAIRSAEGLLSPEELRNIRLKYKMTQADMESLLSTGAKTWTRWERGKVTQSKATDSLLRVFASEPSVARCMLENAGIVNVEAIQELERAEVDARNVAKALIKKEMGSLDAQQSMWVERIAEIAMSVNRDILCRSMQIGPLEREKVA